MSAVYRRAAIQLLTVQQRSFLRFYVCFILEQHKIWSFHCIILNESYTWQNCLMYVHPHHNVLFVCIAILLLIQTVRYEHTEEIGTNLNRCISLSN